MPTTSVTATPLAAGGHPVCLGRQPSPFDPWAIGSPIDLDRSETYRSSTRRAHTRSVRFAASALIGRDLERDVLTAAVERAAGGHGSVLAIVAEPGLGKSRLLREAQRAAAERGCRIAVGRTSPGLPVPFRPLTEALLVLDRETGVRGRHHGREWQAQLGRVVPSWAPVVDTGEATLPVIGHALLECLEAAGRDGATALALEDLHWSDDETLALVEVLADNVASRSVAVVATMRPEPDAALRLFRALETRGAATVLELTALTESAVVALVRDCLGGTVMPDVERFVVDRSDGNPLFAEELLAGLQSSGALTHGPDGWVVSSRVTPRVPMTLGEAVTDRFTALDPADRAVVAAAAVLGRRFDWRLVATMTSADADQVLAGLRRAEAAQLIEFRDGVHQFRHALTSDVIRELLPDAERRAVAGRALDRLGAGAEHAVAADLAQLAGELESALDHLRSAAAADVARGALSSAVMILRRAELLAQAPTERVDVAIELAEALLLAGDGGAARDVIDEAVASAATSSDPDRTARLWLLRARAAMLLGDWLRADRDVAEAGRAGSASPLVLAEIEAVLAHVCLAGDRSDEATKHAEAAIERGLAADRPEIACEALEAIGRSARFRDPAMSSASFERAGTIALDAGLDVWRLRALHEVAVNEAFIEWRFDRLDVLRREAEAMGAMLTLAVVDLHDAGSLLIGGDVHAGRAATQRCLDACRRYRLSMLPITLIHRAVVAAFEGDRSGAADAAGEALSLAPDDLDIRSQAAGWVDATAALVDGDLAAWWHHLDRGMAIVGDSPGTIPSPWRGQWALGAAVEGDDDPARRLRASHAAFVGLNRAHLAIVDALGRARAGGVGDAERLFADADAFMDVPRAGLPRHLARVLMATPAVELGWGSPATWLREADVWFADAGFHGLSASTRALMRRLDVPVPRRGRGDSEVPADLRRLGVTSREMDVLLLVVDRCSNREIADRLHLSVRTVEKHVASLLTKTNTSDRRGLAALVSATV